METSTRPSSFVAELAALPGGENIRLCMQCGTCTGSCPVADKMQYSPAELIALIRAGLREEVLASSAQWKCLSCYTCTVRCPRGVKITDLMHALERLAAREGKATQSSLTPTLYRTFSQSIYHHGRIAEIGLMLSFYFKTNPFNALSALPVAQGLLSHGRLSFGSPKISASAVKQIQAILDKAASLGGAE